MICRIGIGVDEEAKKGSDWPRRNGGECTCVMQFALLGVDNVIGMTQLHSITGIERLAKQFVRSIAVAAFFVIQLLTFAATIRNGLTRRTTQEFDFLGGFAASLAKGFNN